MIRAFLAAIAVAVGVGGQTELQTAAGQPVKPPRFVLGVMYHEGGVPPVLARLHAATLERAGQGVRLHPGGATTTAFSPNKRKLALGTADTGVQFVDTRRMRPIGFVKLRAVGWVTSLSWQGGTVFAIVSGATRTTAFVVDPIGRQVLQRHRLRGPTLAAASSSGGIVVLTAPREGIGPVELSVVGAKGVESVTVAGIAGGSRAHNGENGYSAEQVTPGLAVDGGRAVVASSGRTVADVSLNTLAVWYHTLSRPTPLLSRLRNWLEPTAEAKILEGFQRTAVALEGGLVAVTGVDYSGATSEPAGLALVDMRDWSLRELDDQISDAMRVGDTLVAYGRRSGLGGYDLQGRRLFHLFEGRRIDGIETAGGLVYVYLGSERRAIVDAASGRVLGRARPGFLSVVGA
jgi:hypothetical protein